jgi:CheY-like chemotaxis protein
VLSKQLRREGHVVYIANHGAEALQYIQRSIYWSDMCLECATTEQLSIVLMDLEMPVMDGITCVKKIRELEVEGDIRGHIPVLALTANARGDRIAMCLEAGMVWLLMLLQDTDS